MKTNEEFKAAVFERRDKYRKKRRALLRNLGVSCFAFVLITVGALALLRNVGTKNAGGMNDTYLNPDAEQAADGLIDIERCQALRDTLIQQTSSNNEKNDDNDKVPSALLENIATKESLRCFDVEKISAALWAGQPYCTIKRDESVCTLTVSLPDGTLETLWFSNWEILKNALS